MSSEILALSEKINFHVSCTPILLLAKVHLKPEKIAHKAIKLLTNTKLEYHLLKIK